MDGGVARPWSMAMALLEMTGDGIVLEFFHTHTWTLSIVHHTKFISGSGSGFGDEGDEDPDR